MSSDLMRGSAALARENSDTSLVKYGLAGSAVAAVVFFSPLTLPMAVAGGVGWAARSLFK